MTCLNGLCNLLTLIFEKNLKNHFELRYKKFEIGFKNQKTSLSFNHFLESANPFRWYL